MDDKNPLGDLDIKDSVSVSISEEEEKKMTKTE